MSETKRFYWLKLQEDFFEDDTIDFIESQENGEKYCLFYLKLCLKALKSEGKLIRYVGDMLIPYDEKGLAKLTRTDVDTVRCALALFDKIGLVSRLDTGEIFINQLNEMVGTETDKAKLMRQKRAKEKLLGNNVTRMLPECYTEKEIDIEKEKETEKELNFPSCVQNQLENINPDKYAQFFSDVFNTINEHNKTGKREIPISKDFILFKSRECTNLIPILKNESPENLMQALKNYLFVANSNTWKNYFSFNAFCKNYVEYTDEFFDIKKYIDVPPYSEEESEEFLKKMYRKKLDWFSVYLFNKNKKDWWENGKPEGEAELKRLMQKWEKLDDEGGKN